MFCGTHVDIQARYIVDEVKDKSGKDINVSSWKQEYVEDLPDQENGCVQAFLFCLSMFCWKKVSCMMHSLLKCHISKNF